MLRSLEAKPGDLNFVDPALGKPVQSAMPEENNE